MTRDEYSKTNPRERWDRGKAQPKPPDDKRQKNTSDGPVDESDNGPPTAPRDIGEG
jgi:hypothetical protein